MELIHVTLDDGTGRDYDLALKGTLRECGDIRLITKTRGTLEGNPVALLTFTVELPGGSFQRVQAATTVKTLIMALRVLEAKYPKGENDHGGRKRGN